MKFKRVLLIAVALGVLAGAGYVAYRLESPHGEAICQVCGRGISAKTAYEIETASGTVHACCPACAMHFMLNEPGSVRKSWATDFNTGKPIPASNAYYDSGGDTQYCTAHHPPVERGTEGVTVRVYDRCLPTLVAFSNRDEADAYQRQHGGRVVTYEEALASVRSQ